MTTNLQPPNDALIEQFRAIVGARYIRMPKDAAKYFDDPRGRFEGKASLVLLPANTNEVAAIVTLCNKESVGIIPFGGGTGVVAGQFGVENGQSIIVSLERMNQIRSISSQDRVITADAGCVLETLQAASDAQDMFFPLSMASKGSCTLGGNLATNAGGIQVLRYGNARDICIGIEAVLPNGEILNELAPLRKNNTGYDLRHLLVGSEGTLAIITAASMSLGAKDQETVTLFCAIETPADGLELLQYLRSQIGEHISAMELMSGFGLELVCNHFPTLRQPFSELHDWQVLIQANGPAGLEDKIQTALASAFEKGLITDAVQAQSQAQANALWDLRENTPDSNRAEGAFCNSDTAVPLSSVSPFIDAAQSAILGIDQALRINTYGHIGDGNIHINVFAPSGIAKADYLGKNPGQIEAVRNIINEVTATFGGSISAEHGIGRLKTVDLTQFSSDPKINLLRQIKGAIDPKGIMNPGAVIA